ncbi:hypothetical protein C8J57DRAFT_1235437 [Mycena rebaudengoi]|nr:hypothetical protein C8J57DRAFT_1235437 [Mycena rebaudengoi]
MAVITCGLPIRQVSVSAVLPDSPAISDWYNRLAIANLGPMRIFWRNTGSSLNPLGLPAVPVAATAVDSTATRQQQAVEQWPIGWAKEFLTRRYCQRHSRNGLLTGPWVEKILLELFYTQK